MTLTRETDTETIATLRAQLDSTLKDRARIMAERDELLAAVQANLLRPNYVRAEAAEAKLAERDAEIARLRDAATGLAKWVVCNIPSGEVVDEKLRALEFSRHRRQAMTTPERIWAVYWGTDGAVINGAWADTVRHFGGGVEYILATPEALAASPEVQAMVMAEREQMIDSCNQYMAATYGISAIGHPIDRARIEAIRAAIGGVE